MNSVVVVSVIFVVVICFGLKCVVSWLDIRFEMMVLVVMMKVMNFVYDSGMLRFLCMVGYFVLIRELGRFRLMKVK